LCFFPLQAVGTGKFNGQFRIYGHFFVVGF
jgi:hypothetical protein